MHEWRDAREQRGADEQHVQEVCGAPSERALFKQAAVARKEEHVEQEVKTCVAGGRRT